MTWSYDPAFLATNEMYQVRFELQDTDQTEMLMQDEEIAYIITQESSLLLASARGAEIIARLFSRQADSVQNPTVKLEFKSRVKAYRELAMTLRKRASGAHAPILVSGSRSLKDSARQNTDRTGPYFSVGMQDGGPRVDDNPKFATGQDPLFIAAS